MSVPSIKDSLKKFTIPNLKKITTEFKINIYSKAKKEEIIDTISKAYDKFNSKSKHDFELFVNNLKSNKKEKECDDLIKEFKNLDISENSEINETKDNKVELIKIKSPEEDDDGPSKEALEVVEKAIQCAKKGEVDNFQKLINKMDIGLRYYLISNIPINLKTLRGLFIGNKAFIFKSGFHYSQFTPYNTENVPKFTPSQINKKFDKELEIVDQGKMKGFESDIARYALFKKDYKLLDKYHDEIGSIMDYNLLEFINNVLRKSVVEDDYELCKSILSRMYNSEMNKGSKIYLHNLAQSLKNERMIKLCEDAIQNPKDP
jgi:hypothetical protein